MQIVDLPLEILNSFLDNRDRYLPMQKTDLFTGFAISLLIAGFLIPTLINTTTIFVKFPALFVYGGLFVGFPILTIVGLTIAGILGKKLAVFWQFAKFGLVGVLNTAIDFGILNILLALTHIVSGPLILFLNTVSFSTASINSYYWNRSWVFHGAKKSDFVSFMAVTLIGLAINSAIIFTLTTFVHPALGLNAAQWANAAKLLATSVSLIWNFVGYRVIVFAK